MLNSCVYLTRDEGSVIRHLLEEVGCEVLVGNGKEYQDEMLARCDALVVGKLRCTEETLQKAPNLKVVAKFGVGMDRVDIPACTQRKIWVTNTPLSNYVSVAEHTLMLMLAVAKKMYPISLRLRREDPGYWCRNHYEGMELFGKTLCIVGLGNIGRRVSELAAAFGMNIIAYDPFLPKDKVPQNVRLADTLEEALPEADVVSIHIPGTPQTKHLIGDKEFSLMKTSAILLNLSRGFVVDEAALINALKDGKIAGAGLDVFENEPNLKGNPLLEMEQVVATPHCAGNTAEARIRSQQQTAQNIIVALQGQRPLFAVNGPFAK